MSQNEIPMTRNYNLKLKSPEQLQRDYVKRVRSQRRADWLDKRNGLFYLAFAVCVFVVAFAFSEWPERIAIMMFR